MIYNTYYNKLVPKGVVFLETFQNYIFEVLELTFHVFFIVPKGVPFGAYKKKNPEWTLLL
ncbi:hypothetical protein CN505_03180 [Bacillus cereus]|nr:hypothetical protein CN509_15385 [Bacillus cereus]PET09160.1 hypothetical protein CN505_03180 [Bacillus cereus]